MPAIGASTTGGGFTLWPDTLGFAALDDADLVRRDVYDVVDQVLHHVSVADDDDVVEHRL